MPIGNPFSIPVWTPRPGQEPSRTDPQRQYNQAQKRFDFYQNLVESGYTDQNVTQSFNEARANLAIADLDLQIFNGTITNADELNNAIAILAPEGTFTPEQLNQFEQEGLDWALKGGAAGAATGAVVGAGIGAAAGSFAGGVGAGPGALAGAKAGAIRGAFGGAMGGLGGVLEATGKVGELIRKEMYALGMEFNYENFKNSLQNIQIS